MSIMKLISTTGFSLVFCFFSFEVSAESSLPVIKIDARTPLAISVSLQENSYSLPLPADFTRQIEGLYSDVYIEDINGDGIGEVIFRLEGGDVNTCSKVLHYRTDSNSLTEMDFGDGALCNFKIENGYILGSYRYGSTWSEYVYRIRDGIVKLEILDSCVGCGEIKRKVYHSDGSVTRLLVSDSLDHERRMPLSATISSARAVIFSSPETSKHTKKYLTQGDEVTLLDFLKDNDDRDWIEFRYSGAAVTEGWLKCSDLENCDGR
ncbi:hypothetical protein [Pseudomonas sp. A-R-19]|uniref:hypothetical protein n=1 Tax=Pseudomonas sp. A-R-19 TaxID=2832403 RepID=UPI001CC00A29|nr:hypothetical protein [Pseudomonas sp. A-R-19]